MEKLSSFQVCLTLAHVFQYIWQLLIDEVIPSLLYVA